MLLMDILLVGAIALWHKMKLVYKIRQEEFGMFTSINGATA